MFTIRSKRLLFRKMDQTDVNENYVGWLNDPMVNQFLETRFIEQTIETCEIFVRNTNNDPSSYLFGIFEQKNSQHIGNIKLGPVNPHHLTAQISFFIGEKNFWGKGLATEIIACITAWGFNELKLERIEAGCYDENIGSLKAFLKAGYTSEGYFRKKVFSGNDRVGCYWLGILKDECI